MKKNSQVHFLLETSLYSILKKEAKENGVSVSELCRRRIIDSARLELVEAKLERIEKLIGDKKV